MPLEKPVYVSDLIVYLLHRLGVEYVTLNPGATTRGMHESLATYGGNPTPEVITCCHEEIAAAMAEGYYLATGKPLATLKWDDQPQDARSVAESLLRAYQIAMIDPKGPVYLCFDVELQ